MYILLNVRTELITQVTLTILKAGLNYIIKEMVLGI